MKEEKSMQEYTVQVHTNGDKTCYQNGKLSRLDGPAVELADGYKAFYKNDKRNRLDGPAIEWPNGNKAWYIDGKELTEEEFNNRNNKVEVTLEDIVKAMNIDIDKTASDEPKIKMKEETKLTKQEQIRLDRQIAYDDYCRSNPQQTIDHMMELAAALASTGKYKYLDATEMEHKLDTREIAGLSGCLHYEVYQEARCVVGVKNI